MADDSGSGYSGAQGKWLNDFMRNPLFVTGWGMLGSSEAPGPAFMQAAGAAQQMQSARGALAAQQQQMAASRQEMALRNIALQQAQARQNFNPSQYLLSNEQQAGGQGWQPPQGAIGNVD